MLIYTDSNNILTVWNGQPVNGVQHSVNIDQLWSDLELNQAGLYRVQEFVVPVGQQISGGPTYTLNGNVVIQTYTTIPLPPPPAPKTPGTGAKVVA
jgi:hypothetical protein